MVYIIFEPRAGYGHTLLYCWNGKTGLARLESGVLAKNSPTVSDHSIHDTTLKDPAIQVRLFSYM